MLRHFEKIVFNQLPLISQTPYIHEIRLQSYIVHISLTSQYPLFLASLKIPYPNGSIIWAGSKLAVIGTETEINNSVDFKTALIGMSKNYYIMKRKYLIAVRPCNAWNWYQHEDSFYDQVCKHINHEVGEITLLIVSQVDLSFYCSYSDNATRNSASTNRWGWYKSISPEHI